MALTLHWYWRWCWYDLNSARAADQTHPSDAESSYERVASSSLSFSLPYLCCLRNLVPRPFHSRCPCLPVGIQASFPCFCLLLFPAPLSWMHSSPLAPPLSQFLSSLATHSIHQRPIPLPFFFCFCTAPSLLLLPLLSPLFLFPSFPVCLCLCLCLCFFISIPLSFSLLLCYSPYQDSLLVIRKEAISELQDSSFLQPDIYIFHRGHRHSTNITESACGVAALPIFSRTHITHLLSTSTQSTTLQTIPPTMVKLKLPLVENSETVEIGVNQTCDPSQSIYSKRYCIKDYLFCSEDNPCPSGLPCIDRVCQCLPNSDSYVTLTPPPVRMYTIGCNFDMKRDFFDGCRDYEYSVTGVCLLNYCSEEVPCYAGVCDQQRNVCVGISSTQKPLPQGRNKNITLGNDPYKFRRDGLSPVLIIIMAAGVVAAIAMMGCMMRMLTLSFKSSFKWASRGQPPAHHKDTEEGDEDVSNGEKLSVTCVGGESTTTLSADIIDSAKFTESSQSPPSTATGITLSQGCTQAPPVVLSSKDPSSVSSMPSPHISPYAHPNSSLVSNRSLSDPFRHGVRIQGGPSTISLAQTMGSVATAAEPASQSTDMATIPTAEGGHDLQQQGPYPLAIHLSPNHGNSGMTYPYNQHSFGSSQPTTPGTSAPTSPLDPPPSFFGGAVGANENPSMAYPPPHNHHPGTPLMFGPSNAQNAMASGEASKPARRNLPVGFASSPVADSIERFTS